MNSYYFIILNYNRTIVSVFAIGDSSILIVSIDCEDFRIYLRYHHALYVKGWEEHEVC